VLHKPVVKGGSSRADVKWLVENLESAVAPLQIHPVKDRVAAVVHAGHVDKAHQGPGAPANLHKHLLDPIRRPQLLTQVCSTGEGAQDNALEGRGLALIRLGGKDVKQIIAERTPVSLKTFCQQHNLDRSTLAHPGVSG
jgi:hypothetical protein